jgi:hypothetical protein
MPPALLGWVAAGPPAFELPPAVLPGLCAKAIELTRVKAAARTIGVSFMALPSAKFNVGKTW